VETGAQMNDHGATNGLGAGAQHLRQGVAWSGPGPHVGRRHEEEFVLVMLLKDDGA
jgi:hypothetical protein